MKKYIVYRRITLAHEVMANSKKKAEEEAGHMGEFYAEIFYDSSWKAHLIQTKPSILDSVGEKW